MTDTVKDGKAHLTCGAKRVSFCMVTSYRVVPFAFLK
jgi:hypothetical protein